MDCQPYYVELLEAGRYAQARELALSLSDDYRFWLTLREFIAEKNLSPESLAVLLWGSAQHPEYERYYASAILNHMQRRHQQTLGNGTATSLSVVMLAELESMLTEGLITHRYIAALPQHPVSAPRARGVVEASNKQRDKLKRITAELEGLHRLRCSLRSLGQGEVTRAADTLRYGSYGGLDWQLLRNELVRLLKPAAKECQRTAPAAR